VLNIADVVRGSLTSEQPEVSPQAARRCGERLMRTGYPSRAYLCSRESNCSPLTVQVGPPVSMN